MKKTTLSLLSISLCLPLLSCGGKGPSGCRDDNHDHLCDDCGERLSYCRDADIDGKCDICQSGWSIKTKALLQENLGELLPFFKTDKEFELNRSEYLESWCTGDTTMAIKESFLSNGKYAFSETSYLGQEGALEFKKQCDSNPLLTIRVDVVFNSTSSITYIDCDLISTEVSSFPLETIQKYLNSEASSLVISPDDGKKFAYEENEFCCSVSYDGDGAKYLEKLISADYVVDYSMMEYYEYSVTYRAISKQRNLAVEVDIANSASAMYRSTIRFANAEVPNGTAYEENIQELMVGLFGETLPYVNANFVFDYEENVETSKYHNYMVGSSYNIDAFVYAVNAFKAREDYSWTYTEDGGFYTFKKDCISFIIVATVGVYESETLITAERQLPTSTTWPAERILSCFDVEIDDEIPAAEGSLFKVYYEKAHPNAALVTVTGAAKNLSDYIAALKAAGYAVSPDPISDYAATAPNKTVLIYITDYTDSTVSESGKEPFFVVEIDAKEKPKPEAVFPLDLVNEELSFATYDGPIPTGEVFTVSYPYGKGSGCCDIMVSIAGGDRATFLNDIKSAGYVYDKYYSTAQYEGYVNVDKHIVVYVYTDGTNADYDIEFGLYFSL